MPLKKKVEAEAQPKAKLAKDILGSVKSGKQDDYFFEEGEKDDVAVTSPLQQEDRKALALKLTGEIKQDYGNAIRKLRRMHAEKLWQDLGYASFEEYVLLEFGKTRKWGYDELTRLRAFECLESQGVTDPLQKLSKEAALIFRKWENRPEVFVLAYQQIIERGEQPTQGRLEEECEVQHDYLHEASQSPDLTQEEYRAYLKLHPLPYTFRLDKDFQSSGELLEACRSLKSRPPLKAITQVARGESLVALVQQLEPLSAEVAKLKELKERKADLERQKRDKVKELMEEVRKVEDEIVQAEGEDADQEGEDEDGTTDDTRTANKNGTPTERNLDHPLLADLKTNPSAFIEDAAMRWELLAIHADLFKEIMQDVSGLLNRTHSALEKIRLALVDNATAEQDAPLEPEPVPVESVEA